MTLFARSLTPMRKFSGLMSLCHQAHSKVSIWGPPGFGVSFVYEAIERMILTSQRPSTLNIERHYMGVFSEFMPVYEAARMHVCDPIYI